MSVDDRLRSALAENAASYDPEVERRLGAVRFQQRRRRKVQWGTALTLAAASVAVVIMLLGGAGDSPQPVQPVQTPSASATPQRALLTGEYAGRVEGTGALAGRWVLRLDPVGTLGVTPPSTYDGVLSGVLFQATDEFSTNLFQEDTCSGEGLGRYAWQRSGRTLTFTVRDDACAPRVRLLAGVRWHQVG
jgi:hypothetical protein